MPVVAGLGNVALLCRTVLKGVLSDRYFSFMNVVIVLDILVNSIWLGLLIWL